MNIHVQPLGQPTPGSARPGNLYADLQSRSLWLGVDLAVDASGSVLISDMLAAMDEIAAVETRAYAYTDAGLATKSDVGHVHTVDDITNFDQEVTTIVAGTPGLTFKRYTVMAFAGPDPTLIGTGDWIGWAVCDGTSYQIPKPPPLTGFDTVATPDLRDKFILGRSAAHGQRTTNLVSSANTNDAGAHVHGASNVALTLAQLPIHAHGPGTLLGPVIGAMDLSIAHSHFITCTSVVASGGAYRPLLQQAGNSVNVLTDPEPGHRHGIAGLDADIGSGVTANAGSGSSHTHTIDSQGIHKHALTTDALREAVPFVALVYVMKL